MHCDHQPLAVSFVVGLIHSCAGIGHGDKKQLEHRASKQTFFSPKDFIFNRGGGMCACGRCLQRPEKGVEFPVAGVKSAPEWPSVGADPLEALRS